MQQPAVGARKQRRRRQQQQQEEEEEQEEQEQEEQEEQEQQEEEQQQLCRFRGQLLRRADGADGSESGRHYARVRPARPQRG